MLISRRLLDVAHRMDGLRAEAESSEQPVPIESLGYDSQPDVIPIESLAPDRPATESVKTSVRAGGLELSFNTLERLIKEDAPPTAAFAALLNGGAADEKVEDAPVSITTLCYRGQAALERANAVRLQITTELDRNASLDSLQPLLQELLDLVPMALAEP
jgi:hypothetical protein